MNRGLLDLLSPSEVEGVIAHEIGHIKHRDTLTMAVVAALAGAVMTIVNLAQWSALFGGSEDDGPGLLELLAMALIAPLAATLIQLGVSRAREFDADATAAQIAGSADGLISALAKLDHQAALVPATTQRPATAHLCIVNPLRAGGGAFLGLFSTHPPMAARIERLHARFGQRAGMPAPAYALAR